jgi:D-alanyl-D-alanine carboxypeptidase
MRRRRAGFRLILAVFTSLTLLIPALATTAAARTHSHHKRYHAVYSPPKSAIIIDATTGKVLYADNATAPRYPASLTKMMTLYLLFEQLRQGKLTFESMMPVSAHAAAQRPTKLGLTPGESISVDLAIKAIVVRSANDVAVTIAEALGGSESAFAAMMTRKAHALGMSHTTFRNASGLPNPGQLTTAHDLALLGRHIAYDFPEYYHYFATPAFTYQGEQYTTHDNLLTRFDGTDGIKTGYTNASGFNLVSSVVREGKHIIGVVMGGRTARARDNEMIELLADTFERARKNPTLVAQANVPWHNGTETKAGTMVASAEPMTTRSLNLRVNGLDDSDTVVPATDDEDAAETMTAADAPAVMPAARNVVASAIPVPSPSPAPQTVHAAPPTPSRVLAFTPPVPAFKPALSQQTQIAMVPAPKPQMVLASLEPAPKAATPESAASPAPEESEGDISYAGVPVQVTPHPAVSAGAKHWAVQIGAFGDEKTAKIQLALYAERSMDVLGRTKREIIPFASVDGQKLFRARFGPFAENEAREVCRRMTERGQTCFAATFDN